MRISLPNDIVNVPVVPYVKDRWGSHIKASLWAWSIARCFDREGSSRIERKAFVAWAKLRGWSNPYRIWNLLIDSSFCTTRLDKKVTFLKGIDNITSELHTVSTDRRVVKIGTYTLQAYKLEVTDGLTLPSFKKWWTHCLAQGPQCQPKQKASGKPGRHSASAPTPLGRSLETISEQAGEARSTAARHLWGVKKVKHYEEVDAPQGRQKKNEAIRRAIEARISFLYAPKGKVRRQLANSYPIEPSKIGRRILFKYDGDGQCVSIKSRKAKFGRVWKIETGPSRSVQEPTSPLTRWVFQG